MKIDLQIHTTFSDGDNTPKEIAELAHNAGVGIISATEHDNVYSFREVEKECIKYGIKAISGVEISTKYNGKTIHILGYNIDIDNQNLNNFLLNIVDFRKEKMLEQFHILNQNLRSVGKKEDDITKYKEKDYRYFTIPGLALFLFEEGIVKDRNDGFNYITGIGKTVPNVNIQDAIKIIHEAGGKAIMSHPLAPKVSLKEITLDKEEQEKIISEFIKRGLDGLEGYGTGHSKEDTSFCLQLAKKYNLIITAGSDRHGKLENNKNITKYLPYYSQNFGDLEVPEEAVKKAIKDLGI